MLPQMVSMGILAWGNAAGDNMVKGTSGSAITSDLPSGGREPCKDKPGAKVLHRSWGFYPRWIHLAHACLVAVTESLK